jgi:hypothetical protein
MTTNREIEAIAAFLRTNVLDAAGQKLTEESSLLLARLTIDAAESARETTTKKPGG